MYRHVQCIQETWFLELLPNHKLEKKIVSLTKVSNVKTSKTHISSISPQNLEYNFPLVFINSQWYCGLFSFISIHLTCQWLHGKTVALAPICHLLIDILQVTELPHLPYKEANYISVFTESECLPGNSQHTTNIDCNKTMTKKQRLIILLLIKWSRYNKLSINCYLELTLKTKWTHTYSLEKPRPLVHVWEKKNALNSIQELIKNLTASTTDNCSDTLHEWEVLGKNKKSYKNSRELSTKTRRSLKISTRRKMLTAVAKTDLLNAGFNCYKSL